MIGFDCGSARSDTIDSGVPFDAPRPITRVAIAPQPAPYAIIVPSREGTADQMNAFAATMKGAETTPLALTWAARTDDPLCQSARKESPSNATCGGIRNVDAASRAISITLPIGLPLMSRRSA